MEPTVIAVFAGIAALVLFFLFSLYKVLTTSGDSGAESALTRQYQPFELIRKDVVSHNTTRFRFKLPRPDMKLGLPIGQHMFLRFGDGPDAISRAYTPVSSDDDLGYFDLVIKVYPDGKMSQHLQNLPVGGTIDCRGPIGHLTYNGKGKFVIRRKPAGARKSVAKEYDIKRVGMLCGGTGITPMLQVMRAVHKDPSDSTRLNMIFGNVTEDDILLRDELDEVAAKPENNTHVYYTLDRPSDDWQYGRGFITADMISQQLPPPAEGTLILVCGPPGMVKAVTGALTKLGYTDDMVFTF